ncbi:MFS general substrate transporter [Marasmius fiardii PR-910]|nr:MFS general substrate transporter [Marasmius fiardii PR-910]
MEENSPEVPQRTLENPQSNVADAEQTQVVVSSEKTKKRPYCIYTRREKWVVVTMIAVTGVFSPLSSSIYFPAIPTLSNVFNKSVELINLTVTMYMVFQAISPMVFGTLADTVGRRLMYASCLLILSLSCVGLALVPVNAYWLLLLLRCFQAAGSASTIALGSGVIADIAEPAERGGFYGIFQSGPVIGPAIAPIIGGALTGSLGWRSIFWFLCIAAGVAFIVIIVFLPETLRAIVGDGSIVPPQYLRPVVKIIGRKHTRLDEGSEQVLPEKKKFRNPLGLLKQPDIFLLLLFNGWGVAVFYSLTATISTLFVEAYPFLSEVQIGLCFLGIGGGSFVGTVLCGRMLDFSYRRTARKLYPDLEPREYREKAREDEKFPIEQARLEFLPYFMVLFVGAVLGYGWTIQSKVHISAPLILNFIVGLCSMVVMTTASTLSIDLAPNQSSSIAACNNLVRGALGATLVAVIDLITRKLGPGWTYVLLGGICALLTPSIYVVIKIGPRCRAKRRARQNNKS